VRRRGLLLALLAGPARAEGIARGRVLRFPRDHGAHLEARTEWWYATGWAGTEAEPRYGFQLTFFRSRTGLAEGLASRFAARQLLFAHAAITDLGAQRHLHAQRIARWSGDAPTALAAASTADADLRVERWTLRRDGKGWHAALPAQGFAIALKLQPTQPLLLQGEAGFSRKGPDEAQASEYYSEPQLAASGTLALEGRRVPVSGRAWLDHEWSDALLHADAVGWDWIGIDLFDGSALTAFRLRRADGSALWAGGSLRGAGATTDRASTTFAPDAVRFAAGRRWTSPATQARYPVQWQIDTPAGAFEVRALMDAQELDSRASTGAVYWEGLSELRDAQGRRVGLGYLEMTGYAAPLRLR
jgi:predicted secreted hydrolase